MRKIFYTVAIAVCSLMAMGFTVKDGNISYEGKTAVVNTTKIGANIEGYAGPTPVKIYISKGKIQKIETLKNSETPEFFEEAKAVLAKFIGADIKKVSNKKVDAVSGATFSSEALIKNVKAGVEYYNKKK